MYFKVIGLCQEYWVQFIFFENLMLLQSFKYENGDSDIKDCYLKIFADGKYYSNCCISLDLTF